MARPITLRSPLSPDAVAAKLRDVLGQKGDAPRAGVSGHGNERDMMLFVYRPNFQNSFATNLTATMDRDGGGTRITGQIGTPASGRIFLIVWFGLLSIFLVAAAAMAVAGLPFVVWGGFGGMPLGMMAFGWLIWRLGTMSAKKDEAAILQFLSDTLQAKEVR